MTTNIYVSVNSRKLKRTKINEIIVLSFTLLNLAQRIFMFLLIQEKTNENKMKKSQ